MAPTIFRNNRREIIIGLVLFVVTALYWHGISGVLLFFSNLDPSEGLPQKLEFLAIPYLPALLLFFLGLHYAPKVTGRSSRTVVACVALPLLMAATLSSVIWRPW